MKKEETKAMQECFKILNAYQERYEKIRSTYPQAMDNYRISIMIKLTSRVGITLDDIDKLKIIHVSGTKGKGSTCAFCESILRHQGFKTGLFCSPHLVSVRDRFRINGQPLSETKFLKYFWEIYEKLEVTKGDDFMPGFFGFFTVMAFYVFIKENVDVAIIEVGKGGHYDCTNIICKPVVCGVTSLGLDHMPELGNTIEKIAWHKAGIFKFGVPAFTSPQPPEAMQVLRMRAVEAGCKLSLVPEFSSYLRIGEDFELGIFGDIQKVNASLALQLTRTWMENKENKGIITGNIDGFEDSISSDIKVAECFSLTPAIINGLEKCTWLGRNQEVKKMKLTYYLDSAHTLESIQQCVQWFEERSKKEADKVIGKVTRLLIFNITGERDIERLVKPIVGCEFDGVVFCADIPFKSSTEQVLFFTNMSETDEARIKRSIEIMDTWKRLSGANESKSSDKPTESLFEMSNNQNGIDGRGQETRHNPSVMNFLSVYEALQWASHGRDPNLQTSSSSDHLCQIGEAADHIQVLVTGSLRLVGNVLSIINDENN